MHKFLEDYINTGQWKDPGSNPTTTSTQDGESSPDQALVHVNEIWGTEVNYIIQNIRRHPDLIGMMKGNRPMDFKQTQQAPRKKNTLKITPAVGSPCRSTQ